MSSNRIPVLILAVALLTPTLVWGQTNERDDTESLRRPDGQPAATAGAKLDLGRVAAVIVEQTNTFRRGEGLSAVKENEKLTETARYFAGYLAKHDEFGHTADGKRPADRASEHGYEYCVVSENIAYQYHSAGFRSAQDLAGRFVQGWKDSPGHRRNMLDPDVTETGVAVARSPDTGYYYAVQMFGRPKSDRIEFTLTNEADVTVQYRIGDQTFPLPPGYARTHQRCRPAELIVHWPQDQQGGLPERTTSVKPADGEHYAIVPGEDEALFLRKRGTR
jgi:uncharacterized protein YkwD